MSTTLEHRLSPEQIATYRRDGYIVYDKPVFASEKFAALKTHFDRKFAALPPDHRPESMDVPHLTDPALFEYLLSDEALDLVEPLIGPNIALFSSHFICKPKGNGKKVPWHEDSYYWRGMLEPMQVATIWLAIDPSMTENGAMQVIPAALHGYSEYEDVDQETNVFCCEVKKHQVHAERAVTIELQPGHASIHDGKLMHGSPANTSNLRRCGYTMRYIPTSVKFNDADCGNFHQIYLARGKDLAGNRYADPTRSYPELLLNRAKGGKNGH